MGKKVTLGGDRVGSGKKMQAELHNYFRSTHNLTEKFASSMGCGILYPAMCKLGMRGDVFDININADCRTIPTIGPLFGTFKMQVDVYQCPIRLYQGILHNNPLAIGLNMAQVKFPKLVVSSRSEAEDGRKNMQMNSTSLLKYLGLSGLGSNAQTDLAGTITRKINALPILSYYDIFKTYYANKQEENAYVISNEKVEKVAEAKRAYDYGTYINGYDIPLGENIKLPNPLSSTTINFNITIEYNNLKPFKYTNEEIINFDRYENNEYDSHTFKFNYLNYNGKKGSYLFHDNDIGNVYIEYNEETNKVIVRGEFINADKVEVNIPDARTTYIEYDRLKLIPFTLGNIDDMRYDLLSSNRLGTTFEIKNDENVYLPYEVLVAQNSEDDSTINTAPLNGLVVKTYQNDIFNNWLNTEWIEGENGINELTKVSIVDGAFSMDSLNFATKLYNMLNRIAVAGGTYEDWQDVVYEEVKRRQIESPIFVGGMSQEVVFDEIVQTAPSDAGGESTALGTLGGRGRLNGKQKGGRVHVKCDEACFIIAMVSLTPRIFYTQGNEFYMTELDSMDDLHKPAMDGIGFQDLLGERLAWWDTKIAPNTSTIVHRTKIGKLPAWIEYMTSVDKAYGDFAEEKSGFMILNRRYEFDETTKGIKDATTYIDPAKYNYAFAYKELDAQNFWVEIEFGIKARRLMSARLIPNV